MTVSDYLSIAAVATLAPREKTTTSLRVAFLTPTLSRAAGGIFEVERRLAQCLSDTCGSRVEVYGTRDEFTELDTEAWGPVRTRAFPYYGPRQFRWSPGLRRAFAASDADIAHLHALWMHTSLIARQWSRKNRRPYITTVHGMLDAGALRYSWWKKRLGAALYERNCLESASCIHVNSEGELGAVRAYGIKCAACIVPNGVDLPTLLPASPPWAANGGARPRVLLYLGRLHPKKGLINLLHAWKRIVTDGKRADDWRLVIAGWDDGGHERELRQLAGALESGDAVEFVRPLYDERKAAAFHHADAFVLPSLSEGLPMAVLEAWSYGKPVVMTPQCNLPEGFAARGAIRVSPDVASIVAGLHELLAADDSERAAMGARGRELVGQKFTWPQIARQMHEVYSWLVYGGPAPSCVVR